MNSLIYIIHFRYSCLTVFRFVDILIYQDLSFGEILAGQPGAWLVKTICFICMKSQNFKKDLNSKQFPEQVSFFMIALTVYE